MKPSEAEAYTLVAPALLLFAGAVAMPLAMTAILSLNSWDPAAGIVSSMDLRNYREIFGDSYFADIFIRTLRVSLLVTLVCVLIGVPEAYILRRMSEPWRSICIFIVICPLLISVVARTLGWALLFSGNGLISQALQSLGLIGSPISLMYTETGVVIALVHVLCPFMVLATWASLSRMDPSVEPAAQSLGAPPFTIFRRIVLPLAMPGVLSGCIVVFSLAASAFATPAVIGGRRLKVVSTLAYDELLNTLNWPLGAAIASILLVSVIAVVVSWNRLVERRYAQIFQ